MKQKLSVYSVNLYQFILVAVTGVLFQRSVFMFVQWFALFKGVISLCGVITLLILWWDTNVLECCCQNLIWFNQSHTLIPQLCLKALAFNPFLKSTFFFLV